MVYISIPTAGEIWRGKSASGNHAGLFAIFESSTVCFWVVILSSSTCRRKVELYLTASLCLTANQDFLLGERDLIRVCLSG
jgi:hypothetical protein